MHLRGSKTVSKVEQNRKDVAELEHYLRAQCTQTNLGESQLEGSSEVLLFQLIISLYQNKGPQMCTQGLCLERSQSVISCLIKHPTK